MRETPAGMQRALDFSPTQIEVTVNSVRGPTRRTSLARDNFRVRTRYDDEAWNCMSGACLRTSEA